MLGALAAAVAAIRRSHRTRSSAWPEAFLAVWVAVPIAIAFAVSYAVDPIFEFRYLLVILPAFILLVADGIALTTPATLFLALALGASAVSARSLDLCRPGCATPTQDFRGSTAYLRSRAGPGDQIRFDPAYLAFAYAYYSRHLHEAASRRGTARGSGGNPHPRRAWLLVDEVIPTVSGITE